MCAICESNRQRAVAEGVASDVIRAFQHGDVIFREGEPITGVHCIHSGTVALMKRDDVNGDHVTFVARSGDLLGVPGILVSRTYINSATALETVETSFISREDFLELMRNQPELMMQSMRQLCNRIGLLEQHLDEDDAA